MATATIKIQGATYNNVPSVRHSDGNGNFNTFTLTSDATAAVTNVEDGFTYYGSDGTKKTGTMVINSYYTGTDAPASSLGSNGDIYFKYVPR